MKCKYCNKEAEEGDICEDCKEGIDIVNQEVAEEAWYSLRCR